MSVRTLARLCLCGAALTVAALAVACGGGDDDDSSGSQTPSGSGTPATSGLPTSDTTIPPDQGELTLEEYFEEVDKIFDDADVKSDAADAKFTADLAATEDFEAQIAVVQTFLGTIIDIFSESIGRMDALTPPPEAVENHQVFIDAAITASEAASEFQIRLDGVESPEEATEIEEEFNTELSQIVGEADIACLRLQGLANENNIDIDLTCS